MVNCFNNKLKFAFLLLEYCKIRECYAVAKAFTIRNMYSLLLYMNCNSRKQLTTITTLLMHSQCALSEPISSSRKTRKLTVCRFGGGEFTKTLRKVCTCQKLKFAFLLLEYWKIRECYAVANASDESEFIPDYI
jgi:hypothetical protein